MGGGTPARLTRAVFRTASSVRARPRQLPWRASVPLPSLIAVNDRVGGMGFNGRRIDGFRGSCGIGITFSSGLSARQGPCGSARPASALGAGGARFHLVLHPLRCLYRRLSDRHPGPGRRRVPRGRLLARRMHLLWRLCDALRAARPAAPCGRRCTLVLEGEHRSGLPRGGGRGVPCLRRELPRGRDPLPPAHRRCGAAAT